MTTTPEPCSRYVGAWLLRCPRPVKAEGLCGPHLAGRKRSKTIAERHRIEREEISRQATARRALEEELQALLVDSWLPGRVHVLRDDAGNMRMVRLAMTVEQLKSLCRQHHRTDSRREVS